MVWRRLAVSVAVAPFTVWALVRLLGLDAGFPLVQLTAFTPYVAVAAVVAAVVAFTLRRWVAGAVATSTSSRCRS